MFHFKKKEDEFSFSITPYTGYEREILKILNKNRDENFTLEYLNWKYLGENSTIPPVVFWAHSPCGSIIGMSSVIYRAYWINNKKFHFAVLGDISINEAHRGKGFGKKLIEFNTAYLKKNKIIYTFCIGTSEVVKILSSIGWEKVVKLNKYVFLIDSSKKLYEKIRWKTVSKISGDLFFKICSVRFSLHNINGYQLKHTSIFDYSFETFWKRYDKNGITLRDRSLLTLKWRYSEHPFDRFKISKIFKSNEFIGFIIYKTNNSKIAAIYDFVVTINEHYIPGLILFIRYLKKRGIYTVQMSLVNENYFYSSLLRKIGFYKRPSGAFLQMFMPRKLYAFHSDSLLITQGDKDI